MKNELSWYWGELGYIPRDADGNIPELKVARPEPLPNDEASLMFRALSCCAETMSHREAISRAYPAPADDDDWED
jgi:hypothetical protein